MKHNKHIIVRDKGLQVRIKVGDNDFSRSFSFKHHGGKRHALAAAFLYRAHILKKLNRLEFIDQKRAPTQRGGQSTAIVGVYRAITDGYPSWAAAFTIKGKRKRRYYSINKYGEKGAFYLACVKRYAHAGTLIVVDKKALPCRPKMPSRYL